MYAKNSKEKVLVMIGGIYIAFVIPHYQLLKKKKLIFIVELAALLHDIADHKFNNGDETIGPKWLKDGLNLKSDETSIIHIKDIIANVSFKGANVKTPMQTLEGKIVQDADRLDALAPSE